MIGFESRQATRDKAGPSQHASQHLNGVLCVPSGAYGVALIVRGAAAGGLSPLSHGLADALRRARLATCVVDLLDRRNPDELSHADDLDLLANRLAASIEYLHSSPRTRHLPLGLVADGVPAAAAVQLAANMESQEQMSKMQALALWCPRWTSDLHDLSLLSTPSLLVVPGRERAAIEENERAFTALNCPSQLAVILGADADFAHAGTLTAAHLVVQEWFEHHLWQALRGRHAGAVSRTFSL